MTNTTEFTDSEKEELIEGMKKALAGRLEGATTGITSALFGLAIIQTGRVPFIPAQLSMLDLVGGAVIFGSMSAGLYLYRTRPYKQRVSALLDEVPDDTHGR